jgi:hypothetical protein
MKIIIHAGTHKTGSTSLQVFLRKAEKQLEEQGILVPGSGRPSGFGHNVSCGHHVLAWSLRGKWGVTTDESWHALCQEINVWKGDRVVLSAEDFQNLTTEHIARIREYLDGYDLHMVAYVRNPLGYMISSYKQRVKMGTYAGTIRKYAREFAERLDYGVLINRWVKVLGSERVHVRIFDKVRKEPGLEVDFCRVIGADIEPLRAFVDKPANVSPSDKDVAIMRRINRQTWWTGEAQRRRGWPARLRAAVRRPGVKGALVRVAFGVGVPDTLVTHAEIDYLRDAIRERHEVFLERYVAPEDRDLLRF